MPTQPTANIHSVLVPQQRIPGVQRPEAHLLVHLLLCGYPGVPCHQSQAEESNYKHVIQKSPTSIYIKEKNSLL